MIKFCKIHSRPGGSNNTVNKAFVLSLSGDQTQVNRNPQNPTWDPKAIRSDRWAQPGCGPIPNQKIFTEETP